MNSEKPMKIIIIEDDLNACKEFLDCAGKRTDVVIVGITDSSDEGLTFVKNKLPEAVILDMELNWGEGSGFEFLEKFNELDLSIRPIIVVTTQNRNISIQKQIHVEYSVHWVFCKFQTGYSAERVLNHLVKFRPFLNEQNNGKTPVKTLETPEEKEKRVTKRIKAELNAFGMSTGLKGRVIAEEAIFRLIYRNSRESETVFHELAKARKTHYNNIVKCLQTAIYDAWQNTDDVETLAKVYTAPVRKDASGPSPTEFIHYYADKIRRDL